MPISVHYLMPNDSFQTPPLRLAHLNHVFSKLAAAILLTQLMLIPAVSVAQDKPDEPPTIRQRISQKINSLQSAFQNTPPDSSIRVSSLMSSSPDGYATMLHETDMRHASELPVIRVQATQIPATRLQVTTDPSSADNPRLDLIRAVQIAVNRHPAIAQTVAQLSSEYSQVDVAKAGYWPQLQAGITTGRLGTSEAGRQLVSLNATQTLYDFGKVRSNVDAAEASVDQQKALVLKQIDAIALQTAEAIVNVRRYQELKKIAEQQVDGVARILEITQLRARAGISSQADPVQAQARYEGAQATLLQTETALNQWREKLRTLVGAALPEQVSDLPAALVQQAQLYDNPPINTLPDIIAAESARRAAQAKQQNAHARRYPTLAVEGSLSRALNGRNPSNADDDGTYSSVMLALNSNLSQGGALSASERSARYAEQAARARIEATYLDVTDQARSFREQILGAQRRLNVLADREQAIIQTRELYQEQYKLGTRTALDLLNAEQEIHLAATDRENTRYDIWNNVVNYIAITGRSRTVYGLNDTTIQGMDIQP